MHKKPRLHIYEEVMLLALRDEAGTIASGTMYPQAIGGAVLAELLMSGHLTSVREKKSIYAEVSDTSSVGDPLLDECLQKVRDAKRRATLQTWVGRFAGIRKLKHRVATALVEKGVLRADEGTVLLLFTRKVYPQLDPGYERLILQRLREAIFSASRAVDPRTVVLVALAHHSGLLKANFKKKELKTQRGRIMAVINGDVIGKATREAIQAVQAAVLMAAVMPAVITTTTVGH